MSQHTPGPWEVFDHKDPEIRPGIDSLNGLSIVYGGDRENTLDNAGIHGATIEEELANARLIAASPDMLRLLKEAASSGDYAFFVEVRELIARVEGER